jgi:hypothetical protein
MNDVPFTCGLAAGFSTWASGIGPTTPMKDCDHACVNVRGMGRSGGRYVSKEKEWRLKHQSPTASTFDNDAALEAFRKEEDISARDGLAKGVATSVGGVFDDAIIEWFPGEDDCNIKETLLTGLAARVESNSDSGALLRSIFKRERPNSPLRQRLLTTSEGKPIFLDLRTIVEKEKDLIQPRLFIQNANFILTREITMNTIIAGRDINTQNLVAGDMINSVGQAVQNLSDNRSQDRDVLANVLEFLRQSNLPEKTTTPIYSAVQEITDKPSKDTRTGLLSKLTDVAKAASAIGGAVTGLDQVIEHVSRWVA